MKQKDITGLKFNSLTALEFCYSKNEINYWKFRCDCGKEKIINKYHVMNGKIKSSGCLCYKERIGNEHKKLYRIWMGMKMRCYNENRSSYSSYGGRGIFMCDSWRNDFKNFYKWSIENGYKDGLSIDRIDNEKEYCPDNCRWANSYEQANNKRNTIFIEYNGVRKSLSNWCDELGLNIHTIRNRFYHGFPTEKLFSKKRYEMKGK